MNEIDNDYVKYSQQDIIEEEEDKKIISSLKNGWNILISLVIFGGLIFGFYEDFQDNELFFQSGLSCLESKSLIIETLNSHSDFYGPVKNSFQILVDETNNLNYQIGSDEYFNLSSFEQLTLHNQIIPSFKNVDFIDGAYNSVKSYKEFNLSTQSNFEVSMLHEKSYSYALAVENYIKVMNLYVEEIENRNIEQLIYIETIEEFFFEWELATTSQEKEVIEQNYLDLLDSQTKKINSITDKIDSYFLETDSLEKIVDLEYENMKLNKCNNEN